MDIRVEPRVYGQTRVWRESMCETRVVHVRMETRIVVQTRVCAETRVSGECTCERRSACAACASPPLPAESTHLPSDPPQRRPRPLRRRRLFQLPSVGASDLPRAPLATLLRSASSYWSASLSVNNDPPLFSPPSETGGTRERLMGGACGWRAEGRDFPSLLPIGCPACSSSLPPPR